MLQEKHIIQLAGYLAFLRAYSLDNMGELSGEISDYCVNLILAVDPYKCSEEEFVNFLEALEDLKEVLI